MMKPEYTSSVCQIKSGMDIPATLLTKLLAENRSAIGMTVKEGDKLFVEKEPRLKTLEEVVQWFGNTQANTKKFSRMITFLNVVSGEYDEDEAQPWTLLKDSKGKPLLTVCIDGDFPTFADKDAEGYSEALYLCRDWLGPKIEGMYALVGNNASKVVEYLKTEQFINDFKQVVGHRGVLAFMPVHGDQFTIQKNDIGLQSDWGEVSNAYGYTEAAIEAASPAPAAEKVPDKPAKASRYADPPAAPAVAPAATPPPIPQVAPAPVTDPIEKVAKAVTQDAEEEIDFTPPATMHGKDLKMAYRKALGLTADEPLQPKNWKERPTVRIKVKKTVKSLADLNQTAAAPAKTADVATFPIMSGEKIAHANEFLKKVLGDGSAVISDPVNSNEIEKNMAKFSEVCLKTNNLEDCRRIVHSAIFAFSKDPVNAEAMALWVIELRAVARKYWDLERATAPAALPAQPDQVVVPPAIPGPAPAQVPAPAPAPAAKKGALKYA